MRSGSAVNLALLGHFARDDEGGHQAKSFPRAEDG